MNTTIDHSVRGMAIDPTDSVCVSAPAGSGKTELLIQRYLALLARVQRPEQVLAITFTRKAAAEMRERILLALESAGAGELVDSSAHRQITRALAGQVLAVDAKLNWQLHRNISRLNIKTIDGFCAGLTRQMPVLSQVGGRVDIRDDAEPLYLEAVQGLYALLSENRPLASDLAALSLHFDNNWEQLQDLLVSMLGRRDQWRDYVGVHHAPDEAAAYLLATVETLVQEKLAEASAMLAHYQADILDLLRYAAGNLSEPLPDTFPGSDISDLPVWRNLVNLFMTKTGDWRKTVTKREGFPRVGAASARKKQQFRQVTAELQQMGSISQSLAAIPGLPAVEDNSLSWQLVVHLSRLLPTLVAQLLLVFQKYGAVDHTQVTQSALLALGDDDAPTELALRLDYQIEHILVDEFQDTAMIQYELLQKLTRGWEEFNAANTDRPRTMMIVGDELQSIYGFRGANVGLFQKAQREGLNGIALRHVELQCNFRSDPGLVEWVNRTFANVFPAPFDAEQDQLMYRPATAVRPAGQDAPVTIHAFSGEGARQREIDFICDQVIECIEHSGETIAVLGRNRAHLQPVVAALKRLNISCNAPDLESLEKSPVVADLLTLCRAFANDTDRLAWMSVLRAPWCGLKLADLLVIASSGATPIGDSIWSRIQNKALINGLSEDGRLRLGRLLAPLGTAMAYRDRLGLRVWIEQAWIQLGGPQCAPDVNGLEDAECFFQLLEHAEHEGRGLDIDWLTRSLQTRYMSSGDPGSRVQIMTLHKAKGLEFDRVIIPQLDRATKKDGRQILLWDEHTSARGDRLFLLAADDRSPSGAPTLYNYLAAQRRIKSRMEAARLLYVGATRAIHRLTFTCEASPAGAGDSRRDPATGSLLSHIWQDVQPEIIFHQAGPGRGADTGPASPPALSRLQFPEVGMLPVEEIQSSPAPLNTPPVRRDSDLERRIGTVIHLVLEQLSMRAALPERISDKDRTQWRMALQREGVFGEELDVALQRLSDSLAEILRPGGAGRWVLSGEHLQARSEWHLTYVGTDGQLQDTVIDRSFIDRATGERWLIDYKTGHPIMGESSEDFYLRHSDNYRQQLQTYRDALSHYCEEPLRCALFFTVQGHLHRLPELDMPQRECHSVRN